MGNDKPFVHPYIPNAAPEIKEQLLKKIGIKDVEEIYKEIPESLRLKGKLNLPDPYPSVQNMV
jgi:glycine dehydrogenase subunit 1